MTNASGPRDEHDHPPTDLDPGPESVPGDDAPENPVTGHTPGMAKVLLKGTTWQAAAQFVPLIINLILTPYIMHGLGLTLYGVFIIINTIQAVMGMFNGGIGPSVTRYLTIYFGRGDRVTATRLVLTMSLLIAALAVVVFGIFLAVVPQVIGFFPDMKADPTGAAVLLGTQILLLGLLQVRGVVQSVLMAEQRFAITSIAYLVGHVIYTIGLVLTVERGLGLQGIAWTFVAQQAMSTFIIVPPALTHLTRQGLGFIDRPLLKEFFGYAWKVQLSGLFDMFAQQIDILIVGRLQPGGVSPGQFGPGATFAQQLRMVPMNAAGPMQSIVGRAVGEKGEERAVEDYRRLQRLWVRGVTGWFAVGIPAAYFGVIAWLSLGQMTGLTASILLLAHLFALLIRVQMLWALSVGRAGLDVEQGLCFVILKIAVTAALIIPFGVIGLVVATVIAQLASCLYLSWRLRSLEVKVPTPWGEIPVIPTFVSAAVSAVCVWAASHLVGWVVPHGALGLLTCGLAAGPAFILYMVWTIGLTDLHRMAPQRFKRFIPQR